MTILVGVLIGFLVLMLLVLIHEYGHFLMARRNGVEVEEFGIGFPPRGVAWQKKDGKWRRVPRDRWGKELRKDGLVISLNILPIGGFCKMKDESDAAKTKASFGQASFLAKTKILFGGVVANWLLAILVLTILAWTGMPHFLPNQFKIENDSQVVPSVIKIGEVLEGSPASAAGLIVGDEIKSLLSADGEKTELVEASDLFNFNEMNAGTMIELEYIREGNLNSVNLSLNPLDSEYLMGAGISQEAMPLYRSTWSAPLVGLATTAQLTGETFKGLGELIWNLLSGTLMQINLNPDIRAEGVNNIEKAGESVSGPLGIVGVLFPAIAQSGLTNILFLAALISVSLACMNVLPIPALDGGRWLLIAVYRLRKKELTMEIEERIVGRAFMALIGLIIVVTILDLIKIF